MIAIPKKDLHNLLAELESLGCVLTTAAGGQINIDAPTGVLTPELVSRVREHKQELLRLLRCDKCGSKEFIDFAIHAGRSIRRDCAEYRQTAGFPRWEPCKSE